MRLLFGCGGCCVRLFLVYLCVYCLRWFRVWLVGFVGLRLLWLGWHVFCCDFAILDVVGLWWVDWLAVLVVI